MPNALFVTPGDIKTASARFRAIWPAEHMRDVDIVTIEEIQRTRAISPSYKNYIWIKVFDLEAVEHLAEHKKNVWWDLCDPVHWFEPMKARHMADLSTGIVFSNQALCDDFVKWYGPTDKAHVIVDRLKLEHYKRVKQHTETIKPRFIWFGAGQNRLSLYATLATFARLEANGVALSVTIFDDKASEPWRISNTIPTYHATWALETENEVLADHDIAVLPPYPGPWGNVKSNNKTLTAWACGLPVTDGINYTHTYRLATELAYRTCAADIGSKAVLDYDVRKSAQEWIELLCS